jgi:hypothetical protein
MLLRDMESGARKRPRTNSYKTGFSGCSPNLNRGRQDKPEGGNGGRGDRSQPTRGRGGTAAVNRFGPVAAGKRGGYGGRSGN